MKKQVLPAACLVALAGLALSATVSLGGDGGQASGLDMSVSAVSATTGGSQEFTITTAGVPAAPTDNPNARWFAITMCTVSCNVGTVLIPFQADPQYNHPYIATNMYRINAQGRLEQLTASWIKHAFSSASASQGAVAGPNGQPACGTGSCGSGSGSIMGLNCSDTYGSGLNASTYRLGPRGEIHPNDPGSLPVGATYIGWNPTGSFFDLWQGGAGTDTGPSGTANGTRNYTTGSTNTPWKYNLLRTDEIDSAALGTTGRVIMEAYYVLNGDVNKVNNHAWRKYRYTQPANSGSTQVVPSNGAFVYDGPHTFAPPIMTWGDQQQLAQPSTDGSIFVASRVVNNGDGTWRYEYNVYNQDFYRQINSVELGLPSIADRTAVTARHPRQQTFWLDPIVNGSGVITSARQRWFDQSGWTNSYDNSKGALVFAPVPVADNTNAPTPTNPTLPNNLRWGTMYTYWFTSNMPPRTNGTATLKAYMTGGFTEMTARISVPKVPCDITGIGGPPALPDGQPTVDDLIAFVNAYSEGDMLADISSIGGAFVPDTQLTVDDLITFVNTFSDWQ